MSNLEKQVAALVRLVMAEDSDAQKKAKAELLPDTPSTHQRGM